MKKIFLVFFIGCLYFANAQQHPPFWKEIQEFKTQDSLAFPEPNQILFAGSSSFTKWTDVQDYFPGFPIINRGFGGSSLTDLIRYANDIILPYQPRQIVIYCGENDFAANEQVSAAEVAKRFYLLFSIIRKKYKKLPVVYVSMKPSPSRIQLMPKFDSANYMIKQFLKKRPRTAFADVYHAMLQKDGTVKQEIFLKDNLHMNSKGYHIWQQILRPYLKK
ncbi:MAG: G-D-S-L family lipolytic protein [Niastella sp. SCN 39-18]|nr:G-D-S-L family lipolytic protein [Sphingobacteriales bacterium]ODT51511.1 MAG: G-D-S-L family lipolytic protein [Niastella sp. SCN 39-18]OJW09162.1 MAG: G-D-S-L family lipolytic protein [Sphingobacteriales bacterium 39-19]